jgi:hypothetical protein
VSFVAYRRSPNPVACHPPPAASSLDGRTYYLLEYNRGASLMVNIRWRTRIAGPSDFELRLIEGDARSTDPDVVVFGRSKTLRTHYLGVCRDYFADKNPFYIRSIDINSRDLVFRISARKHVLSSTYNPRAPAPEAAQEEIDGLLNQALQLTRCQYLVMVPLTWRHPEALAAGTVAAIWELAKWRCYDADKRYHPKIHHLQRLDIISLCGIEHYIDAAEAMGRATERGKE